jgi:hypothetical protein
MRAESFGDGIVAGAETAGTIPCTNTTNPRAPAGRRNMPGRPKGGIGTSRGPVAVPLAAAGPEDTARSAMAYLLLTGAEGAEPHFAGATNRLKAC